MPDEYPGWHGTTIIGVRKEGKVVVAGDGQVSLGQTVIKGTATKVRRLRPGGHDIVCRICRFYGRRIRLARATGGKARGNAWPTSTGLRRTR